MLDELSLRGGTTKQFPRLSCQGSHALGFAMLALSFIPSAEKDYE
ncbi:MAG: hypothetical protein WBF05_10015 [Anaerolineales bacterium]